MSKSAGQEFTPKQETVTVKKVKIMSKPTEDKESKYWSISIGFYPGILFGFRTYEEPTFVTHVMYLPFIDFAIEIDR